MVPADDEKKVLWIYVESGGGRCDESLNSRGH